jgi:hypothetical protein
MPHLYNINTIYYREIILTTPSQPATTNIFYKRILEFGVRDDKHALPGGTVGGEFHEYTIDWSSERIIWYIDGVEIRRYTRASSFKDGEYFYPSSPSLIQIGAWDGGDSPQQGVSDWAGGPVPWGNNEYFEALYGPLQVQCYNDKDEPVAMWPVQGNRGRTEPKDDVFNNKSGANSTTTTAPTGVIPAQPGETRPNQVTNNTNGNTPPVVPLGLPGSGAVSSWKQHMSLLASLTMSGLGWMAVSMLV